MLAMRYPLLVTSYVNPDLDGTAGVIAYTEFLKAQGKEAVATLTGNIHSEAKHILERFQITPPPELDPNQAETLILIDTSIPSEQDSRLPLDRVIEIIDHRALHEGHLYPKANLQIELVGAAATLVAERLLIAKHIPSRESAILLYAAIASNTVNFKASVTTERDHAMARWLQSITDIPKDLITLMFASKSDMSGENLRTSMEGDFCWRNVNGREIGIAQLEILSAQEVARTRHDDIIQILNDLKNRQPAHEAFLSIIDLMEEKTVFVVPDQAMREVLAKALQIAFKDTIAIRDNVLMRKQIGPILKDWYLQNTPPEQKNI